MKKTAFLLVFINILAAFSGCVMPDYKNETVFLDVFTGEEHMQEWSSEYNELIAVGSYPVIWLCDGAEKYPELTKTLKKLNEENETAAKEYFEELAENGYEWYNMSDSYQPFSSIKTVKVRRSDEKVLSILFEGYEYRGGMHGIEYYIGENYDVTTGQKLEITDVIKDIPGLSDAVSKELSEHYTDVDFFENTDIREFVESENLSWTYDYNGITLYFGPYTLAPYVYGTQTVTATYEEYPELFGDKIKSPDSFATEMTDGISLFSDTDKDGGNERLYYTAWGSETGEDGVFRIHADDEIYEEKIYFYDADVTFVKTKKGNFIYAEFSMDNDYRETRIYEINDKISYVGMVNASKRRAYEEALYTENVITNPDNFTMETRTYILSTIPGIKNYYTGDDGMPVSSETDYVLNKGIEFTVLEDFNAEVFNEDMEKKTGEITVKTGDVLLYIATDNEKYVWFETEDYKIIRKEFIKDGYKIFIDGMNIYDVFDGMFFAG